MTDTNREATERFVGGGLTAKDCRNALEQVIGVVFVHIREDIERHQLWLHVRGGDRVNVMAVVTQLEEYKPAAVYLQVDHAPAELHHHVIAETPWIDPSMIG